MKQELNISLSKNVLLASFAAFILYVYYVAKSNFIFKHTKSTAPILDSACNQNIVFSKQSASSSFNLKLKITFAVLKK